MKGLSLGFCALLMVGPIAVWGQDKLPAIAFDSQAKDFGKVIEGETLKHVFKFTNKGQATLEVLKVEPS